VEMRGVRRHAAGGCQGGGAAGGGWGEAWCAEACCRRVPGRRGRVGVGGSGAMGRSAWSWSSNGAGRRRTSANLLDSDDPRCRTSANLLDSDDPRCRTSANLLDSDDPRCRTSANLRRSADLCRACSLLRKVCKLARPRVRGGILGSPEPVRNLDPDRSDPRSPRAARWWAGCGGAERSLNL